MEKISIIEKNRGKRIDKFLTEEFFSYTRGELIRRIKKGEVLVNGKKIKPSYELKENDEIQFHFIEEPKTLQPNKEIAFEVIFEDNNVIIINKPAGIQVHPSNNEKKYTLINGLIAKYPELKNVHDDSEGSDFRPGIVHRLDKNTSGIMVIARNKKSFKELKQLFKDNKIKKTYVALVHGILEKKNGFIDKPLARSLSYKKQIIANAKTKTIIRNAFTEYTVLQEMNKYSLVEVRPKTGRMHQIRVHFASLGHPIVGDMTYLPAKIKDGDKGITKRQLLHAKSISFVLFDKDYSFGVAISEDFAESLFLIDEMS